MSIENQQNNNDFTEQYMTKYSSLIFRRGLELAKKVSVVTIVQDADRYNDKGLDLLSIDNYKDALECFDMALEINPAHINACLNKAMCHACLGDGILSTENFSCAIQLNSEYTINYLKKFNEILNNGQDLLLAVALDLVSLGFDFQLNLNYQKAIESYDRALILDPKCETAYYNRSVTCLETKDFQKAMFDSNQVISINPGNKFAYINRGVAKHQQGDPYSAIQDYEYALQIDPTYELAFLKRGIARLVLGDRQGAIDDYTKVIDFCTDNSLAYIIRAEAYFELGYESQAKKDSIKGYMLRGNQHCTSSNYAEAIESYNHVLEVDPNNAEAYNRRSTARSVIGDYQGAMEDLQRVKMI